MLKLFFRMTLSILLLAYFSFKVDWRIVCSAFADVNIGLYLISTGIAVSGAWFMACKYYLLIRGTSLSLPVLRVLSIHFISRFYALFLPTALGPEAVRWFKVTKGKQGKGFFLAATIYERILFLLVLFGFGVLPLLLYEDNKQLVMLRDRILPIVGILGVLLLTGLFYLMSSGFQRVISNNVKAVVKEKHFQRLDPFLGSLVIKDKSMGLLMLMLIFTICWQVFFIGRIFFLFQSMGLGFGVMEAAWMGSLVLLLQVLPISFAGLGVREGAYAYLFTLLGLPAEKGFLVGILFFTQMLVFVSVGAVLNLFEK